MHEVRVVDERLRLGAAPRVQEGELGSLISGEVVLEQDRVRAGNEATGDRIVEGRQLDERAAAHRHTEELHRPRQVAAEQERLTRDVCGGRRPQLEQSAEIDGHAWDDDWIRPQRIADISAALAAVDVLLLILSWSTCGGDGDCPTWHEWTNLLTLIAAPILLAIAGIAWLVAFDRRSD
jgi:hypothetical protein